MRRIKLKPTKDYPLPYELEDDSVPTLVEKMAVAGNTAELQRAMGAQLELPQKDIKEQQKLLDAVVKKGDTAPLLMRPIALAANVFLKDYGAQLALDVAATRAAITNKLMEIANCGDPKYELKALELLGKHSDIGLFTERSEVTINYKDPKQLEEAIKEKLQRLASMNLINVTPAAPLHEKLEDELGHAFDAVDEPPSPASAAALVADLFDDDDDDDGGDGPE